MNNNEMRSLARRTWDAYQLWRGAEVIRTKNILLTFNNCSWQVISSSCMEPKPDYRAEAQALAQKYNADIWAIPTHASNPAGFIFLRRIT